MNNEYINVKIVNGENIEVKKGTTLLELSKNYQQKFQFPIVLAKLNNSLKELNVALEKDVTVEFLDITDANGFRAFQRSVFFLAIYAVKQVAGEKARVVVSHSINKNYYCETPGVQLTEQMVEQIEGVINDIIEKNIPIEKVSISLEQGLALSNEFGLYDKIDVLKYRRTSKINFYKLNWYYDYFYGQMVLNTNVLKGFKISKTTENKFILKFPNCELIELEKMSAVFHEANRWAKILKVDTVGALNKIICKGNLGDLIRVSEALHEKKIANIADMIYKQNKTIVLIAGPSSSGKTTFAERLCIQLRVNGLKPYVISMDNYFNNAKEAPLDKNGNPDFESIDHIRVKTLNEDLENLLKGNAVLMPTYNFLIGKYEYKGNSLHLGKDEVLVIEGIHGLNEVIANTIPKSKKFKIFISALTQLNIDDHNRIATSDTRLIRRIVRDNQFRAFTPERTISTWQSVMNGEAKHIFPFQEEADAFFNSALVYEMCVLKQFVEPLLFNISNDKPQYTEARRLVKFLDSFLGISSEQIPKNSILREFIGGSCFAT